MRTIRVYTGYRKEQDGYYRGVQVKNDRGDIIYNAKHLMMEEERRKFGRELKAIEQGLRQYRQIAMQGVLGEIKSVKVCIGSKTIFKWLVDEDSPKEYIEEVGNILLELSLMQEDAELVRSRYERKIKYKNKKENMGRVVEMLESIGVERGREYDIKG